MDHRVVIVEDAPDVALLVDYILSGEDGIEVVGRYTSATDALYHDWEDADTAVVDWMMPKVKGDTLLKWLKGTHPHVRRIMLSAAVVPEKAKENAHEVITKGGNFQSLIRAVKGER